MQAATPKFVQMEDKFHFVPGVVHACRYGLLLSLFWSSGYGYIDLCVFVAL
jgi:hypothetical protein